MNTVDPIVTIAHWTVEAATMEKVLALVGELRRRSLEEPGCRSYEVLRSVSAPDTLVLLESYSDPTALEAHRSSKHYHELLVERVLPLLTSRRVDRLRFDGAPS